MGNKTDTNVDADMHAGEAAQEVAPTNLDDLQDVITNSTVADVEPENVAAAQTSDVEANQDADPLTTDSRARCAERSAFAGAC